MKLLFCFLLLTSFVRAQDDEISVYHEFEPGETYYTLADSVNLRATPEVKGKLVTQLPIGSPVTIIQQSPEATKINNVYMYWYQVEYAKGKKAYIWGGKIAQASFRNPKDYETIMHFGISKLDENGNSWHEIRLEKKHQQIQKIDLATWGLKWTEIQDLGDSGLKNVDDVIMIGASGQFCGDNGGSKVIFLSGGKLTEVLQLDAFFDAPVFAQHSVYFPKDMKGMKDKILLEFESGEYVDDEADPTGNKIELEEHTLTTFHWNGSELISEGIKQLKKN